MMSLIEDTARYYDARSSVYDETAGYDDPEAELLRESMKNRCRELFQGYDVLEVACGTGYWTEVIGQVANSLVATDINPSVLSIARDRCRHLENVRFQVADAYSLEGVPNGFTAALGVWWWSHIPKEAIAAFLGALHDRLRRGALIFFRDQLPYGGCVRKQDEAGNTLELRSLPDGRTFWVVKNFPGEKELRLSLRRIAEDIQYVRRPEERHWDLMCRSK
jgi:SAM-dependent methyltransferase